MPETAKTPPLRVITGRKRLAEIMAQYRQPHDEVFTLRLLRPGCCEIIEAEQRMVPYITFRMPLRILPAADKPLKLRIIPHPADLAQKIKPGRDANSFYEQLRPFSQQAFARQSFAFHRPAEGYRFVRRFKTESCDKLHSAQDPQRIFPEMIGNMAQYPAFKIGATAPRVENFTCQRIGVYGIHGKIPPRRSFFESKRRIVFHGKRTMPETEFGLPARQRNVNIQMLEFDHAERRADEIKLELFAQDSKQIFPVDAETLNIAVT